jgi:hypothetical protein
MSQPLKAIRRKCLDCCCGSRSEVRACELLNCSLYEYRFGTNPHRKAREYSPEQQAQLAKRLTSIRRVERAEIQQDASLGDAK